MSTIEFSHQRHSDTGHENLTTAGLRLDRRVVHAQVGFVAAGVVLLAWVSARLELSALRSGLVLAGGGVLLWGLGKVFAALVAVRRAVSTASAAVSSAREEHVQLTALEAGLEIVRDRRNREVVPWDAVRAGRFRPAGGLFIELHENRTQPFMVGQHQLSTGTGSAWESFCEEVVARAGGRPTQFSEWF